jgi:hypothetical protein
MSKYPFQDAAGVRGRPYIAPKGEIQLLVKPAARSLDELKRNVSCTIKDNFLILDLSKTVSDKIKIKKKDAIEFANWITQTFAK